MSILKRFVENPSAYFKQAKFYFAGLYFDIVLKKYRTNNCVFTIPKDYVNRIGRGYFALGLYEKDERSHIGEFISGNETVLELGGCIGVISSISNRLLNDRTKHIVVEANPTLIEYLDENKKSNDCGFVIENVLISRSHEVDFFLSSSFVASGIYESNEQSRKVKVRGVLPQELEEKHGLKFDTIIMDIEGGEYNVILENQEFLTGITKIFMEEHQFILGTQKYNEYEAVLLSLGFQKKPLRDNITIWSKIK